MTTIPNTETQELIEFIKDGFAQMSRDMDNKFNELDKKIDRNQFELQEQIIKLEGEIKTVDARQKNVKTAIQKIPEITEKFDELKKRCDPADVSSAKKRAQKRRQLTFVVIAAAVSWFARGQN